MYIAPFIFFGLVAVLTALFALVIYMSRRPVKSRGSSDHVLLEAEREGEKIVRASVEKAQETLMDAQYIKDDLIQSIESSMRAIAEAAVVSFQEETQKTHLQFRDLFSEIEKKYSKETAKTVEALEKESEREMSEFRKSLQNEIIEAQRKAEMRAEEAFRGIQTSLEEYRIAKIKEMDNQARDMIEKVFVEVLGKSFTGEEHEKLVVDALESAKKDGVLGAREYRSLNGDSSKLKVQS